ncbi:MAG: hypothetical protein ACSNEK_01080 [Parachlamydiaceae bacterium]
MNFTPLSPRVPYFSDGIAEIEGYILTRARNEFEKQALVKRLYKEISESKPILKSLAHKRVININHYTSNLYTLLYSMIEEQLELLKRHQITYQDLLDSWYSLKVQLSHYRARCTKDGTFIKNLKNFLQSLIQTQITLGIEVSAFHSSLNELIKIASFIHIGDISLCCLFEYNKKGISLFELPVGTLYNALNRNSYLLKRQILWIAPLFKEILKVVEIWVPPPHPTYEKFKRIMLSFSPYLETVKTLSRKLAYFVHCLAENKKIHLEEVQAWQRTVKSLGANWIRIELRQVEGYDPKVMKQLEHLYCNFYLMVDAGDFFLNDLLDRSAQILISTGLMQHALKHLSPLERQAYFDQPFPIYPETSQVQTLKIETARKSPKKTQPKQRQKVSSLQKKMEAKNKVSKPPSFSHAQPLPPCQPTPPLKTLSSQLYYYARSRPSQLKGFLIHAAWHLEKVSTIQGIVLSSHGNIANLFSAFSFHLAHTLEQLLLYHLAQNNIHCIKSHNLNLLHMLGSLPDMPIIQQFYLATYWARYPLEEFEGWRQATHFHKRPIPDVLKVIVNLADDPRSFTQEDFTSYFKSACTQLEEAISFIIPSKLNHSLPSTFTASLEPLSLFNELNANQVITQLAELSQERTNQNYLKIKESLFHTQMLVSSLTAINQANTISEFTFWASRIIFLVQQSIEALMHSLELFEERSTEHDVGLLAKNLQCNVKGLGNNLINVSQKLKYPFQTPSVSTCALLIDQITSLTLHPDMENNFEYTSSFIPDWPLPLKNITSRSIACLIEQLLAQWQESMLDIIRY